MGIVDSEFTQLERFIDIALRAGIESDPEVCPREIFCREVGHSTKLRVLAVNEDTLG